jgi:hypothetical protein
MSTLSKPIFASCAGVLAHYLVFIHGQWHLQAPAVVKAHLILGLSVIALEIWNRGNTYKSYVGALALNFCYLTSLFASIIVYRLYFHRIRYFPGPCMAATSKLWHVWQCRDSRNHLVLEQLYQKYGKFVRTGKHTSLIRGYAETKELKDLAK